MKIFIVTAHRYDCCCTYRN